MNLELDISPQNLSELVRRRGARSLSDLYGYFARLLESSSDLVFVKDTAGRYVMVNAAYARYVDMPTDNIIGARDEDFIPEHHARYAREADRLILESGVSLGYEVKSWVDSGWFYTAKAPVRDADDHIIGVIGIVRDISERKRVEDALRLSESRLAAAQAIAHLGSWEWNLKTNEVVWSDESYRIYGVSPLDFTPNYRSIERQLHPADVARMRGVLRKAARLGEPFKEDARIVRPDGEERHVHIEGVVTRRDADDNPLLMTGTVYDITDRKRTELALRRSESNFVHAQRVAHVGSWVWEVDADVVTISDEALRVIGTDFPGGKRFSHEEFFSVVHEDDRAAVMESVRKAVTEGQPYEITFRVLQSDGSERLIHSLGELQQDVGQPPILTGVARDVTESARISRALAASRDELQALTHHLQHIQEEERRRIAREIHDEFGAVFTAANLSLYRLANQLGEAPPAARELLAHTKEMIANAGKSLDDIVNGLHPQMLGHLGVPDTFTWYLKEFANRTGLRCTRRLASELGDISEAQSITLFRCLQESLTNIAKHAQAREVRVELGADTDGLRLSVCDDGVGVDPERRAAADAFGLRGMEARVRQLGGRLDLRPRKPRGTAVIVTLPRHTAQQI